MQIKTVSYYYVPIRRTKIHNNDTIKSSEDVEQQEPHPLFLGMQNDTPTLENHLAVCYKTKCTLTA